MLLRIASFSHHHRGLVLALWLAVLVGGFAAAPSLFGALSSDVGDIDDTESARAEQALWDAAPTGEEIYAVVDGLPATDDALRHEVDTAARRLDAIPGIADVRTPWSGGGEAPDPAAVATDGHAVVIGVQAEPTDAGEDALEDATDVLRGIDAPRVMVGGETLLDEEMEEQAASDLARAEMLTTPVVLVLLLVIFGGIVAAGLPVIVATVGVAATLGMLFAASTVLDVSVYSINVITMLGLGLAVDYALLLVSRFREERAVDPDVEGAFLRTYATAGRTVAFSGLTVAASLAGLLAFPDDFLRSMGLAGLAVVLLDLVAALTLLPALLSWAGHRIRPATGPRRGAGVIARIGHAVRGRRITVVVVATVLLALAATPFLGVRYADPDERSLPASSDSRELAEQAADRFGTRADLEPLTVVAEGNVAAAELDAYVASLRDLDGVRSVSVRDDVPGLTVVDVLPEGSSQGPTAMRLVGELRDHAAPAPVQVTGDAAELADYESALRDRLPVALAIVALATFVLLFLFTGSVLIPLKAIVMNVLSLGASLGALVWVFQEGHLGGLVGTEALDSLSITTPVLVFAIAFGLSMDYEVFLLGRIAEAWRRTGDNDRAVDEGLRSTAGIITAAALLMIVVFAGFVAGGFSPVKQVGLGLVVAVAVDATIVRLMLVPAVMSLLGEANWWAPRWLRRLHRRFGLHDDHVLETTSLPSPRTPARAL